MAFIAAAAFIVVLLVIVGIYNKMIALRLRTREALADIDTQLKRRHDVIPNLVATVKGYAAHENKIFDNVTQMRAKAMGATTLAGKGEAEAGLTQALKSMFAVAEAYPDLKANQNFLDLQRNISEIEDALQNARRYYNAVVRDYNISIATFPAVVFSGACGFATAEFFRAPDSEKESPSVDFS